MVLFDFILGDAALLEAAKKGNLARVQKLASQENINCRDTQGRNSTPLHLAGINSVFNIDMYWNWKSFITSNKPLSRIRDKLFLICASLEILYFLYVFWNMLKKYFMPDLEVNIIGKWLVKF